MKLWRGEEVSAENYVTGAVKQSLILLDSGLVPNEDAPDIIANIPYGG